MDCFLDSFPSNRMGRCSVSLPFSSCRPQDSPARLVSVCQKLQCDYKEMRTKILAGVSLEQLEPLSVSSARLTSGSPYTPPQVCLCPTLNYIILYIS